MVGLYRQIKINVDYDIKKHKQQQQQTNKQTKQKTMWFPLFRLNCSASASEGNVLYTQYLLLILVY